MGMTLALQRLATQSWQILAMSPLLALAAYWMGGEPALVALAALVPLAVLAFGRLSRLIFRARCPNR